MEGMLLPFWNMLYRSKDPTRSWRADPTRLVVDVRRCTLCEVAVGGAFEKLHPLGPSSEARKAARGYPEWHHLGLMCMVEEAGAVGDGSGGGGEGGGGRIGDFTVILRPDKKFRPFPGRFFSDGQPIAISSASSEKQIVDALGEPFGRSHTAWDPLQVLFYEFQEGEAQFAFEKESGGLDSIEFWEEPELSQPGACEAYGIQKAFPNALRRAPAME